MGLEIPGARAAILSPDMLSELRQLLGFRRFFRHACAVELDAARLVVLQGHAARLRPFLERDLDRLERLIGELADLAAGN